MKLKINITYKQLLTLIYQLPKKDIKRLAITLQSEIESGNTSQSLQTIILDAPTWGDKDLKEYNHARIHLNQSRIV